MRIIQLIQKLELRGAQIFACQLANHLQDLGHTVRLLCLFDGREKLPFYGEINNLRLSLNKRFFDFTGWKQLANEVRGFDADVIQANAGDTLKYAVLSKLLFRWKAPIVFRNASTMSQYIKTPWVKWWNAFLFRFVAHVVSVSEASRKDFLQLFPFMKGKTSVISIGIECIDLPESIPNNNPYLLHVGGFTFEKNHEGLLRMFQQIQNLNQQMELWMVGDGPLRVKTEHQMIGHLAIRFLGFRTDVLQLMRGAKALLLPSNIEGLPGVILEAMYCKIPVVAYDVGGISEVVKKGETGWLVRSGDEEGFVNSVLEVLAGDNSMIVANAYNMVVNKFDNREITKRFLKVYKEVVKIPL